jgi:hypothetical protein
MPNASVPNVPDGFVRTDDFKSVFAGIAGARDEHTALFKVKAGDLVFLQTGHAVHPHSRNRRAGNARINEFADARALHGNSGVIVRSVSKSLFVSTRKMGSLRLQP